MKIYNSGRGIHRREISGIERLKDLPDNWVAYTNLDLILPGKGAREIDVVMVLEDRLLLLDLKDWYGPISSKDGNWFNGQIDCGRSPIKKISENVRELVQLLQRFVVDQQKRSKEPLRKLPTPWVEGAVVLTKVTDRTGIADTEASRVFSIEPFVRMVRNRAQREQQLGQSPTRHTDFTSAEWQERFARFFNISTGIFRPGKRRYGSYVSNSETPTFKHGNGIFYEFDAEEEGVPSSLGMLRRWDMTQAEPRFQTAEGRADIVGRERSVIAWLDDRSAECGNILLKPKSDDPERGVAYWEVFERRRRTKRLGEFVATELARTTRIERIELARQVLDAAKRIHDLNAAHLDYGPHSVWLERPSTVKVSHLFAASFPEIESLGKFRYQFLSSSKVPEEHLGEVVEPFRKDVFLLGCIVHTLLVGSAPAGDPPEWRASADPEGEYAALHPWFERCLDIDAKQRFANADGMLDAFNAALASIPDRKATIEGLERFRTLKSQRHVFQKYPDTEIIQENERVSVWLSEKDGEPVVAKMWLGPAIGDIHKESSRILAFLERAQALSEAPIPGVVAIRDVAWTGDAILVVQDFAPGYSFQGFVSAAGGLTLDAACQFLIELIDIVNQLHDRLQSHGDLNQQNVRARIEDDGIHPALIDLLDFAPTSDGERVTPAYSPAEGGRFERDRYAVTKLAEELLQSEAADWEYPEDVARAVDVCRTATPKNATLLPLRDALARVVAQTASIGAGINLVVGAFGAESGDLLSDEGMYWISRKGQLLLVRGALERLEITLDGSSRPLRVRRLPIAQSAIQRAKRWEYASFAGQIHVDGSLNRLEGIAKVLEDNPSFLGNSETADSAQLHDGDGQEAGVLENEAEEDALAIAVSPVPAHALDVRELWRRMIQVESELVTEALTTGESSYRKDSRRHVVPVQIVAGDMDFDRNDTVAIERLDRKGNWRKIGNVDIAATSTDHLVFDSWLDAGRGPILNDGDRLHFQSHMENTSRKRRQLATDRILRGASAAPSLFSAFQPSLESTPRIVPQELDEQHLATRYGLNEAQAKGFRRLVETRPLGLLQGPPGTGKTRFIGALVHYAITHGLARNVLIASQSHEAVNNAAEAVLRLFGDERDDLSLIRVGHEGVVSELLKPFHVAAAERAFKDRFVATTSRRMEVIARALGLSQELVARVMKFEDSVVPVIRKMGSVSEDPARINSLKHTIEQQVLPLQIKLDLSQIASNEVEGYVEDQFLSIIPPDSAHAVERFRHVLELGRDIAGSVSTRMRSFETFLAGTRQVVAGTCVGLGRTSLGLTSTIFDLVIVDEAARCTPSEIAVPIQAGKWVVLVGDHAQLEPLHDVQLVSSLAKEFRVPRDAISKSDFQRVFESTYGIQSGSTLTKQYRMLPPIGRIVSCFYERGLQHGRTTPLAEPGVFPPDLDKTLLWVDTDCLGAHGFQGAQQSAKTKSLINVAEADAIVSLLKRWSEHESFKAWLSNRSEAIGIICAYAAQRDLVWRKLQAESLPEVVRKALKVDTIDSYQGKENAIVLLSLVRNNAEGPHEHGAPTIAPGFMVRPNRINVAMSRAMDRLVIVGARQRWMADSPMGRVSSKFNDEVLGGDAKVIDVNDVLARTMRTKKDDAARKQPARENQA